jgi:pimeloyl-ACP methyl ester carboxylesterase
LLIRWLHPGLRKSPDVTDTWRITLLLLFFVLPSASFADTITNFMSPIVSYQYPEDFTSGALTNGGIMSPIVSYQYLEWPSNNVLQLLSSLAVSYYYQSGDEPQLTVVPTNRTPTTAEITQAVQPPGTSPTQLVTFVNGVFTTNAPDPSRMTVVLTHGWNDSPNGWPKGMAQAISNNMVSTPNIVAWDWTEAAASPWDNPGGPANNAGPQGRALGQALQDALGINYSLPIHFIGHSLGTLVNAAAVNYVHRESWAAEDVSPIQSWTNLPVHVTLFDEAEIATGVGPVAFWVDVFQVLSGSGDFLSPKRYNWHPLPKTFVWADNYITAFGLPHPEAVNVILTNGIPARGLDLSDLRNAVYAFHFYPTNWYNETVNDSGASTLGWRWSYEQGGWFNQAPATNTVYMQPGGSPWNLAQTSWEIGTNWLDSRILNYHDSLDSAFPATGGELVNNTVTAVGQVGGALVQLGDNAFDAIINLETSLFGVPSAQVLSANSLAAADGSTANTPAYAWISVVVPSNAVTMSFDFKLLGDGASDSFVAALNGTNILSLAANLIETNLLMNSGQIDVSAYAGQTAELFFGIAGGTSTNAQITVQDIVFYTPQTNLVDSVGDGISDGWRAQYFPNVDPTGTTTNYLSCAACDADGTGQDNLFKYVAGLNPTNPASVFVLQIQNVPGQPTQKNLIYQPIASGHTYVVQSTTDLVAGVWSPQAVSAPLTNGAQVTVMDPNATGWRKFYRVNIYNMVTNIVIQDSVGDGIADSWRAQYFPSFPSNTTNSQSCATCDADATGQNNFFKYVAGLDPTNPSSVFVLNVASATNQLQAMNLNFNPLALGRTYTPEFSTNLVGGLWLPLTTYTGFLTNGNQVTIVDTNPIPPQEFYRIDISLP